VRCGSRFVDELRRAGFAESAVAQFLGTTVEVVRSDLASRRAERAIRLKSQFNLRQEVVRAVDQVEFLIGVVDRELRRLDDTPGSATVARVRCLRALRDLEQMRDQYLQQVGLPDRQSLQADEPIENAEEIRERIRKLAVITDEDLVSDGERDWLLGKQGRLSRDAELAANGLPVPTETDDLDNW
jgi:hypothetical protein